MPDITLPTPGPGGTPGPTYAEMINTAIDAVNDVIETGRLSETELSAAIVSVGKSEFTERALSRLAPVLRQRDEPNVAAVTLAFAADAAPIIASSVTWGVLDGPVDILSAVPLLASGELDGGYLRNTVGRSDTDANRAVYQVEWLADADTEMRLRAFVPTPRFRLYVDDVPAQVDAQVVNGITLAGGTNFRLGIPHPNPGTLRRFRLQIAQAGLRSVYTAPTTSIYAPRVSRAKVAIIGTSFSDNSGSTTLFLDSWVWQFGEAFGLEVVNCARSGSGYVGTGVGTFQDQVPVALSVSPDLLLIEGSGNDVAAAGSAITTAAADLYASLTASDIPVIAVGMLPRGASGETAGPAGKVITFTKAAADVAPNVLAYIDPIGTVDPLPTYTAADAYPAGSKVIFLGTVWRARIAISSAPASFDRSKWEPLSWNFGLGRVGNLMNDGNRDKTVQSDDIHPTKEGSRLIARNIGPRIARVLAAAMRA